MPKKLIPLFSLLLLGTFLWGTSFLTANPAAGASANSPVAEQQIQMNTLSETQSVSDAQSGSGQTTSFSAQKVTVSIDADGKVSLFQIKADGQSAPQPFASFQLPAGGKVQKKDADAGVSSVWVQYEEYALYIAPLVHRNAQTSELQASPFVSLTLVPLCGPEKRTIKTLRIPEIQLSPEYLPDEWKVLGTAGLTPADGHKGSYAFLAAAHPQTRRGVAVGWITSQKGSGIVFSSKTPDGSQITIQPEMQYGRYEIPALTSDSAKNFPAAYPGEIFVIGAFDDCLDGLEEYADEIAKFHKIQLRPQISGYCTWYSNRFSGAGTEESTRQFADIAAEKLVPFGMSYFQIDDHWQLGKRINGPAKNFTAHNPNGPYPSGMKPTAEYLNSKGLTAGIWFMPFSGNWNDPYYADKQEWFVKSAIDYPAPGQKNTRRFSSINQKKGAPYETFWGGTSLDMTDKNVEKYVHEEVDRIANQWGYKYFKYDGIWTAMACEQLYVNDEYLPDDLGLQIFDDMTKTNVEIYRKGLKMVRAAAGDDVFILGCNISQNMRSMAASFGLVDAMRIGPDNGASWNGICAGPIRGTARWFFNGRVWFNDPDPVYVRDTIPLSHAQLITSWAAVTGQLFAFSDWLPDLSDERVNVLQRTIAPACLYTARPLDVFESKLAHIWKVTRPASDTARPDICLFGLFNWAEKETLALEKSAEQLGLDPNAQYAGFDFWGNSFIPPFQGKFSCELPGGTCRILSLVKLTNQPQLVSTNRHVTSPLFEVENVTWNVQTRTLTGTSSVVEKDPYEMRFILPAGLTLKEAAAAYDSTLSANSASAAPICTSDERGVTLRVRFTSEKTGKVNWTLQFAEGGNSMPAASIPQELTGKSDYRKITLTWAKTPDFGYVLTKTSPDGTKKTFTLTGTQFTDFEVKTSETYTYTVQSKGWKGELSNAAEVRVAMPETIVIPPLPPIPDVHIADLKPLKASTAWGSVRTNLSAGGHPLKLEGKTYEKGVGIHAAGNLVYEVPQGAKRFVAVAGLDDFHVKDPRRTVYLKVWTNVCEMGEPEVLAAVSPLLSNTTTHFWHFDVPLGERVRQIRLEIHDADDGINCDHVDWVNAGFLTK